MQDSSLHVAIISTQFNWHGGEQQAALLAAGLQQRGHRCTIFCRERGQFENRMRAAGFDVRTFPLRGRTLRGFIRVRRFLSELRPDIVHANDPHGLTSAGMAGFGLPIPLRIVSRRVDFPVRSKGRYRRFADGIICVSNAVRDICEGSGLKHRGLTVVHDGVDPGFGESGSRSRGRKSLDVPDDQPLLLTVAKLTDHKGHKYLLQAMPQILSRHPNAVLALAGDGEENEALQSLAQSLGIAQSVRFLGYRNDVPDLLAAADVVVQPSHMEGLCSNLIDTMFAERPIVATRAGGIPDLLEASEQLAWLVPPKSPSDLADAIHTSLTNNQDAAARAKRARQHALRNFTADRMVENTLQAYADIANQVEREGVARIRRILTSEIRTKAA